MAAIATDEISRLQGSSIHHTSGFVGDGLEDFPASPHVDVMEITPKIDLSAFVFLLLLGVGVFYTAISAQQIQDDQNCRNERTVDGPRGYKPILTLLFGIMAIGFAVGMPALYMMIDWSLGRFDINEIVKSGPMGALMATLFLLLILALSYLFVHIDGEKPPQVCPKVARKYNTNGWTMAVVYMPFIITAALTVCSFALVLMQS